MLRRTLIALTLAWALSGCDLIRIERFVETAVDFALKRDLVPAEAAGTLTFYQLTTLDDRLEPWRTPVRTRLQATIVGGDAERLRELKIGVRTTAAFVEAFTEPSRRPQGFGHLWDELDPAHKTVLVLRAKGLRLVRGQRFLEIPRDFRRGDTLRLDIQVEPAGTENEIVSATGTTENFPELEF